MVFGISDQLSLVEEKYVPMAITTTAMIKIIDGHSPKMSSDKSAPIKGDMA